MHADPIIWLAAIAVVVMVRDAMHDVRHEPPRGQLTLPPAADHEPHSHVTVTPRVYDWEVDEPC